MALEFFTRTTQRLGSLLETICKVDDIDVADTFERLPDCLVIDILSRLPPHSFLRCRWVCRHWRALVTSQDSFTNILDLCRDSTPMFILCDDYAKHDFAKHVQNRFVYVENKKKKKKAFEKLHLKPELTNSIDKPVLLYSCEGVLMFASTRWKYAYYIFNPITQEEVIIQPTLDPFYICALYFCPYTRQFRILYADVQGTCCQYFVHILKTRKCRKILSSNPFNFLSKRNNPTVVNGALHWIMLRDLEREDITPCENGIMVFRMDNEELCAMPHPGQKVCKSKQVHLNMALMVKDDRLVFCDLVTLRSVDMWILEDYETRLWIKKYKINLLDKRIFPFSLGSWIQLMYIQEGELLIRDLNTDNKLYLYDLDHKTVKILQLPRRKMSFHTSCIVYHKSFQSID